MKKAIRNTPFERMKERLWTFVGWCKEKMERLLSRSGLSFEGIVSIVIFAVIAVMAAFVLFFLFMLSLGFIALYLTFVLATVLYYSLFPRRK